MSSATDTAIGTKHGDIFLYLKNGHLSSFMVRTIWCLTHHAQPPPLLHPHLNLLSGHVLVLAVWFGVQLGPTVSQSSHGFKALHCLLNHNTNCPGSGLNEMGGGVCFQSVKFPLVYMICLWGSLHLIKWASLSLWGLPIKVESKRNSMPPADSDWWSRCFITKCTPTTSLTRGEC